MIVYTVLKDPLDNINGFIGRFNQMSLNVFREISVVGIEHKRHKNPEQFSVFEKKFHIDIG